MSPDELKMVFETIKSVSGDASSAAIWWIALHYGVKLAMGVLIAATVGVVAYMVIRLIANVNSGAREMTSLAAFLGVTDYDAWYGPDRRRMWAALTELKRQADKPKE